MENLENLGAFIIVAIVAGFFLIPIVHDWIGSLERKPVIENHIQPQPCNSDRFLEDYGSISKGNQFNYNKQAYFFLHFDNNINAIVESKSGICYIIEERKLNEELFRTAYFYDATMTISRNFYSEMMTCNQDAVGAEKLCGLSSTISNFTNSNIAEITVNIPEGSFNEIASSTENKSLAEAIKIGEKSIKLVKILSSLEGQISIELIKSNSCNNTSQIRSKIFYLASDINQPFTDSKNYNYNEETVNKIILTNELIKNLYEINKPVFGAKTNPTKRECDNYKLDEVISGFSEKINDIDINAKLANELFLTKILNLKDKARKQMETEKNIKWKELTKNLFNFINVPKLIDYWFHNSGSEEAFKQQKYVTSKKLASQASVYYSLYWYTN